MREKSPKQRSYLFPPPVYFRRRFKAQRCAFQLWPHRPCWDDVRTDRNANNEHLKSPRACFGLDLWEPYGLLLVRLRLRWMAFLSILGDVLSFSVPLTFPTSCYLFHKSLLQTLLLSVSAATSSETLIPFWVGWGYSSYRSDKRRRDCNRWMLGFKSYTSLETFPPLPGSRAYGSHFRAPLMNPGVAIVVRGGRRGARGSGKDIPSIPVSVWRSKEVCF